MSYFNYCQGLTMTSQKFDEVFGGPPRTPESPDYRARDGHRRVDPEGDGGRRCSRRRVTSIAQTGMRNLCLAGGVALNCVANGRILREGPFDDIWIQPAAGDAGGALGAALYVWYQLLGNARARSRHDSMAGSLLGPASHRDRAPHVSRRPAARSTRNTPTTTSLCAAVADLMASRKGGRVVPGTHGVWPARARRPQHHRRRPQPAAAVDDEPQDQVP